VNEPDQRLQEQLQAMRLRYLQESYAALAAEAAQKHWTHVDYLARLIDGERFCCINHLRLIRIRTLVDFVSPGGSRFGASLLG